jgi:uncharacterized membrane protein YgdD (TMEM256/DUF423 family)
MNAWLLVAAINGFLAVAFGAFAAHGLSGRIDAHALDTFKTGANYHMYHALALGLAAMTGRSPQTNAAAWFFLIGIVLFSGSLYLLAVTGIRTLGIITPFGGLSFLIGWALLGWAAMKVAT